MKKYITVLLVCVAALIFTACSNKNIRSVFPSRGEMESNLQRYGYTVEIATESDGRSGVFLSAVKYGEFLYFYWIDSEEDCKYFYNRLETDHPGLNCLSMSKNDGEHAYVVYCGTQNAVEAAGVGEE